MEDGEQSIFRIGYQQWIIFVICDRLLKNR